MHPVDAKHRVVFGIYAFAVHARRGIEVLLDEGFLLSDMAVLRADAPSTGGGLGTTVDSLDISAVLEQMGMPETDAQRYHERIMRGGMLITVECKSAVDLAVAQEVLRRSNAENIAAIDEVDNATAAELKTRTGA